jgi:hypothetical protein
MALVLSTNEEGHLECTLNGCHCDSSCQGNCGCGKLVTYRVPFDVNRATAVTRLHLHLIFGRQHKLDEILTAYDNYFENPERAQDDGINIMKGIIFDKLSQDDSWKICPCCETDFQSGRRSWEDVIFIVPDADSCIEHDEDPEQ